ncbi:hypothetical protein BKA62DRAFT_666973 [Auriculariales sp. MPI-PUGE-AT-0066]|nr:hypothetical protein BKA62DRAFT_666973 [Auriculariales sp. MPI-PUGE-AT-0066]
MSDSAISQSNRVFDIADELPQELKSATRLFSKFVSRQGEFNSEGEFQLDWQKLGAAINALDNEVMFDRYCNTTITETKETLQNLARKVIQAMSGDLRLSLATTETDLLTDKVASTLNERIEWKTGVVSAEYKLLHARPIPDDPDYMQTLVVTIMLSTTMTQKHNWFGYKTTKQDFCANVKAMKVTLSKDFGRAAIKK